MLVTSGSSGSPSTYENISSFNQEDSSASNTETSLISILEDTSLFPSIEISPFSEPENSPTPLSNHDESPSSILEAISPSNPESSSPYFDTSPSPEENFVSSLQDASKEVIAPSYETSSSNNQENTLDLETNSPSNPDDSSLSTPFSEPESSPSNPEDSFLSNLETSSSTIVSYESSLQEAANEETLPPFELNYSTEESLDQASSSSGLYFTEPSISPSRYIKRRKIKKTRPSGSSRPY